MHRRLSMLLLLLTLVFAPAVATAAESEDATGGTTGGFVLDLPEYDWGGHAWAKRSRLKPFVRRLFSP